MNPPQVYPCSPSWTLLPPPSPPLPLGRPENDFWLSFLAKLLLLLLLSRFSRVWLCAEPIDGSPPGSPIPGIPQARTLDWVAISFSNVWKWKVKVNLFSRIRPLVTWWTAAYQAPPSMGFSRREYWNGVPLSSDLQISKTWTGNHCNCVFRRNRTCFHSFNPCVNTIHQLFYWNPPFLSFFFYFCW